MIMNIVRYDPFREIRSLQNEVNRLFSGATAGRDDMLSGEWMPRVDVFENENHLVLEAELPGMNRDDFDLSIENNVLTLKGERRFEKKDERDNYHRVERAYGSFTRSFTLPSTVTAEGAKAEFKNGILNVTLPKREETKARKIEIFGEDTSSTPKTIEAEGKTSTAKA
jgi:HSP20 family protein